MFFWRCVTPLWPLFHSHLPVPFQIHVESGSMICPNCSHVYPISNGIPNMVCSLSQYSLSCFIQTLFKHVTTVARRTRNCLICDLLLVCMYRFYCRQRSSHDRCKDPTILRLLVVSGNASSKHLTHWVED